MKIDVFDSTLRDGAQGESISFSVEDKLKILKRLDIFGIPFIEAGNPGSNPKDLEFFERVKELELKTAKLVAFGSTRRKGITPDKDENVTALLKADTDYVSIFGKSWDLHVDVILNTTLEENLNMIRDTIRFFRDNGKEVFFDAEHFFDGYKANPEYAIQVLLAAEEAGAKTLVLCETNGSCFPDEIFEITKTVREKTKTQIGIHTHNDSGCAVANTIAAVKAGATHIQGTFIGIGERTGNANLSSIIPGLQLKLGYDVIPAESMHYLTKTANFVAEVANVRLPNNMPYVGTAAFAHKGGMHADGVNKNAKTFEHIDPKVVGNNRYFPLSEVSGRSTLLSKLERFDPTLEKNSPETIRIMNALKEMEHKGYQFEAAQASFELLVLKELGKFTPYFDIEHYKIISTTETANEAMANAVVKVRVGDQYEITADEGDGPVNALDKALRKALEVFYPVLKTMHLVDYKVRVIDSGNSTAATTRVLIECTDGETRWTTVGVSKDIINASLIAMMDSLNYMLYQTMASEER